MATPSPDLTTILRSIASWSRDEQVRLARAILDQLARPNNRAVPPPDATAQPSSSFAALYGLAAAEGPAPSDAQVAEWLDERRMRHLEDADRQDPPK